jgi:hypothetical protein
MNVVANAAVVRGIIDALSKRRKARLTQLGSSKTPRKVTLAAS